MVLRPLLHFFQRGEQQLEKRIRILNLVRFELQAEFIQILFGVLGLQKDFQLANRGPLDCFASNRAFENVVSLILGVDGQFKIEFVEDVDMSEDSRSLCLTTCLRSTSKV